MDNGPHISHAPGTDDPRSRWPVLVDVLRSGHGRLHFGAQVYVSRQGRALADFGFGETLPDVPMTPETVVPWLSAGKPLTAAALLVLCERGTLALDAPVAELIPEFTAGGKAAITWRHLLTHTSGLSQVDTGWPDVSWEESVRRVCAAELPAGVLPGERAAYQLAGSWFALGEALSRVTGLAFPAALREIVLEPLGLVDVLCGVSSQNPQPSAFHDDIASDVPGVPPPNRLGGLYQRDKAGLTLSEWHTPRWVAAPSPGGNCRGPVRSLGAFYESLLGLRSPRVLSAESVAQMTSPHRVGQFDETLQHIVDFGLGVIVQSNRYGVDTVPYGFGRFSSESSFGHGGSQCALGFADPARGLVVVYAANGRPGEPQHQRRNRAVCDAIFRNLGLAD